jgi:hypothetical protein
LQREGAIPPSHEDADVREVDDSRAAAGFGAAKSRSGEHLIDLGYQCQREFLKDRRFVVPAHDDRRVLARKFAINVNTAIGPLNYRNFGLVLRPLDHRL